MLAALEKKTINEPDIQNKTFVLMNFSGKEYTDWLEFARTAIKADLKVLNCGKAGIDLMISYDSIWVVVDKGELLLLALQYKSAMRHQFDVHKMRYMINVESNGQQDFIKRCLDYAST